MRPLTPAVARQAKGTPRSVREQQPTTHQVTITMMALSGTVAPS